MVPRLSLGNFPDSVWEIDSQIWEMVPRLSLGKIPQTQSGKSIPRSGKISTSVWENFPDWSLGIDSQVWENPNLNGLVRVGDRTLITYLTYSTRSWYGNYPRNVLT